MGVVAKMFIQSATENPDGSIGYQLGVVCRGEENKSWAAATPSGNAKITDTHEEGNANVSLDVLRAAWQDRQTRPAEVEVLMVPDGIEDDQFDQTSSAAVSARFGWLFDVCSFSYGGCQVKFRQPGKPWGTLELTINASAATRVLREAYANSLLDGKPAAFEITFRKPEL